MSVSSRRHRRGVLRGFTIAETLIVVAIAGILATLAVASFQQLSAHARAREDKAGVLAAISRARSLAQRANVPVELRVNADSIELRTAVVSGTLEDVRRVVTSYSNALRIALPSTTRMTNLLFFAPSGAVSSSALPGSTDAVLYFCPSSDNYFRDNTSQQNPVCGVGNLASANAKVEFTTTGETHHVRVRAPLAALDLRDGA